MLSSSVLLHRNQLATKRADMPIGFEVSEQIGYQKRSAPRKNTARPVTQILKKSTRGLCHNLPVSKLG